MAPKAIKNGSKRANRAQIERGNILPPCAHHCGRSKTTPWGTCIVAIESLKRRGGRDVETSDLLHIVPSENPQPRLCALYGSPNSRDLGAKTAGRVEWVDAAFAGQNGFDGICKRLSPGSVAVANRCQHSNLTRQLILNTAFTLFQRLRGVVSFV